LLVFFMLGNPGDFDASDKIAIIQREFHIGPILFLPLGIVVVLALLKFPPFTTIFIGAIAGGIMAVLAAPERVSVFARANGDAPEWLLLIKGVWLALANGYSAKTGYPAIDVLVSRGGMASMLNTIWLIITALAFGGVVEKAGVLDRLITPVLERAKSAGALVTALVGSVFCTNIVTADQYIAIVLPARMFKNAFAQRGFEPVVLSRSVGASGTPTGALIPWNSCGAYMSATLGVATFSYLPYAVFNFVSPLAAIAVAYAGMRMMRLPTANEAQAAAATPSRPSQ